ncbi:MAG: YIP1 family protein [Saccharofermentanales bacterium]
MIKQAGVLESLRYSLYLIFHPFKAFWDLKHEKRGNVYASHIILFFFVLFNVLSIQMSGNILAIQRNVNINNINIFLQVTSILLPVLIWTIANWSVTTLMDGEGTIKDIYITTTFALTPYVLFSMPLIILANLLTRSELTLYTFLFTVSIIWSALLIVIGIMTLHQYTGTKTIAIIILTIVGMFIIIAIAMLFLSIIMRLSNFTMALINELSMR